MQFAIYTSGHSPDSDYQWSSPSLKMLGSSLADLVSVGIVVYRNDEGLFSVYMHSENSKAVDYRGRGIRIGLLITGCEEEKMKGLVTWRITHWDQCAPVFQDFCTDFGTDGWTIDSEAIERFVQDIADIPPSEVIFEKRYENANTEENRLRLLEEIQHFDFSPATGLKLIVDASILSGTERLQFVRSEVERYLAKDAYLREWAFPKEKPSFSTKFTNILAERWIIQVLLPILITFVFVAMLLLTWRLNSQNLTLRAENATLITRVYAIDTEIAALKEVHRKELAKQAVEWEKKPEPANHIIVEKEKEELTSKQELAITSIPSPSSLSNQEADLKKREADLVSRQKELVQYLEGMIKGLTRIQQAIDKTNSQ